MYAIRDQESRGHTTAWRSGRSLAALVKKFEQFLLTGDRFLSASTVKKYIRAVNRLKVWARWKRKSVRDLTVKDCNRWKLGMVKGGLVPGTVNVMLVGARRFFGFLQLDGYLKHNPFELVPLLPLPQQLPRHLTPEEVDRLLDVPDVSTYYGLLDRTIMELLYSAGLRPIELIMLELTAVNLSRRLLICNGKGGKQRMVPFGRSALEWLEKYLKVRSRMTGKERTRRFFIKEDGERLSYSYVWRHVRKHGMDAGLNDLNPRVLRHTYATHIHEGGAEIVQVQLLIGHSQTESTTVYTHVMQRGLREVYEKHHPRATFKSRMRKKKNVEVG